jgi:hypothetical protein
MRPHIKGIITLGTVALSAALGLWLFRFNTPEVVEIANACNTFVSQFSEPRTPKMVIRNGRSELTLSFTPAKDEEATRIYEAVKSGTRRLRIRQYNAEVLALGVPDGQLVLAVENQEQAKAVLRKLCFEEKEIEEFSSRTVG